MSEKVASVLSKLIYNKCLKVFCPRNSCVCFSSNFKFLEVLRINVVDMTNRFRI